MTVDTGDVDLSRPGWVSVPAVAWVIDDAPVPADLAWTLLVVARRCDQHGKGSYQSMSTIAAKTGKSEKQARRDIQRLRELGLLVLGDQSKVAHLPAGQRPTVYDVPLSLSGVKPTKESRNKSGGKKTPDTDGTPPIQGSTPIGGSPTPPLDGQSTPPTEGRQRDPLKNPLEQPSSSRRLPTVALVARLAEVDDDEAKSILEEIKTKRNPDSLGAYVRRIPAADLIELRDELRARRANEKPPWCGQCEGDRYRRIEVESGYGEGVKILLCPRCNPQVVKERATRTAHDGRHVSTHEELKNWNPQPYTGPYSDDGKVWDDPASKL